MDGKRSGLVLLVLVSNVAIVAGAVAFEWHSLTVVTLFVADGLLGLVRISLERAFARRPQPDGREYVIRDDSLYRFELWNEPLLNKRGSIRIGKHWPPLVVQHLPYTIILGGSILSIGMFLGVGWYRFAAAAQLGLPFVAIISLFAAKHASIVAVWDENGVYERSAPLSVRHRSALYSMLLLTIAVLVIAPLSSEFIVLAATVLIVPKLLFDFREAGIGPRLLTFDPTTDTTREELSAPTGTADYVFRTDDRALVNWACIYLGAFHILLPGILVFILAVMAVQPLATVVSSLLSLGDIAIVGSTFVAAVGLTVGLVLGLNWLIMWLCYANLEFRIYDDELVAYDHYLEEPQWVVPFEDIRSISAEQNTVWTARAVPRAQSEFTAVELEYRTNENRQIRFLETPDDFVRIVRGRVRERSASV